MYDHHSQNNLIIFLCRRHQMPSGRPLLIDSTPQTEFVLTRSKQTTHKFLTGARTHIMIFSFCPTRTPNLIPKARNLNLTDGATLRGRLPYHGEMEMPSVGESDAAVEADRVRVARAHMQNRNFVAAPNLTNQPDH